MCIRDSNQGLLNLCVGIFRIFLVLETFVYHQRGTDKDGGICLLYTSDAADERSSVDLGGRRIIKKKKDEESGDVRYNQKKSKSRRLTIE